MTEALTDYPQLPDLTDGTEEEVPQVSHRHDSALAKSAGGGVDITTPLAFPTYELRRTTKREVGPGRPAPGREHHAPT